SRASFQSVGVVCSLTKSGRIPSHTTTTTCRSDLGVSAGTPIAPEKKMRTRIKIVVQYFASMTVRRLHRSCEIGRGRPPGAPPCSLILALLFLSASAPAAPLVPTAPGTTWRYSMTEELGKGLTISNLKTDLDGKVRLPVLYRLDGSENVDGKELLKFEMHRAGAVTNTDLVTIDDHGITCWARINLDGELIKLNPPQTMVAAPLKRGASWNFDGQVGDLKVQQQYNVIGDEDIEVPAGEFHAFHIRGEQSSPSRMTIDRWFAPGTGIVKDVTTMRAADGDLLQRISLELAARPKIENRPEVKSDSASKRLSVSLAKDQFGKPTTTFSSDTPQIYVRWQGQRLRKGGKVKAVWIAENIGEDFPQDYKVDEASATVESENARGAFTLARPENGWAIGDYRVEFYVDDVLVEAVKLKIVD